MSRIVLFFIIFSNFVFIQEIAAKCTSFEAAKDLHLKYAKQFRIKILENKLKKGNETVYWLQTNALKNQWLGVTSNSFIDKAKKDCPTFKIITIPQKVLASSTTHLSAFIDLKVENNLFGFTEVKMISSPIWLERIKEGKLKNFPLNPNLEDFLHNKIDLFLTYSGTSEDLQKNNAKTNEFFEKLIIQEYLEPHPLARMEWLKFYGALFNKLDLSIILFNDREKGYKKTKSMVSRLTKKPKLLLGEILNGKWVYPSVESDLNQMAKDLNVEVVRPNQRNEKWRPEFYSYEEILPLINQVEFWFIQNSIKTKKALIIKDHRYSPFQKLKMINLGNSENMHGYNSFWEVGVNRADLLILDFAHFLYPEIFANHQPLWLNEIK